MADMLVKLYNIPHSHDIEENLFKSGTAPAKDFLLTSAQTAMEIGSPRITTVSAAKSA